MDEFEQDEHPFYKKLKEGKMWETALTKFYSTKWNIEEVTVQREKSEGIDRVFTNKKDTTQILTVEFKADIKGAETGNVFLETIQNYRGCWWHVKESDQDGWVNKTQAERIITIVPFHKDPETEKECHLLLITNPEKIRENMNEFDDLESSRWHDVNHYPPKPSTPYKTRGLIVPIPEYKKICKVVKVPLHLVKPDELEPDKKEE